MQVGDKVDNLKLYDYNNKEYNLYDLIDKYLVVYIYPKNNTPGCNNQACNFRDNYDILKQKGINVIGISKDTNKSHENFRSKFKLPFTTFSDESLDVIKYFNSYGEKKMFGKTYMGVKRETFVLNKEGILIIENRRVKAKSNALDILKEIEEYEENN